MSCSVSTQISVHENSRDLPDNSLIGRSSIFGRGFQWQQRRCCRRIINLIKRVSSWGFYLNVLPLQGRTDIKNRKTPQREEKVQGDNNGQPFLMMSQTERLATQDHTYIRITERALLSVLLQKVSSLSNHRLVTPVPIPLEGYIRMGSPIFSSLLFLSSSFSTNKSNNHSHSRLSSKSCPATIRSHNRYKFFPFPRWQTSWVIPQAWICLCLVVSPKHPSTRTNRIGHRTQDVHQQTLAPHLSHRP